MSCLRYTVAYVYTVYVQRSSGTSARSMGLFAHAQPALMLSRVHSASQQ